MHLGPIRTKPSNLTASHTAYMLVNAAVSEEEASGQGTEHDRACEDEASGERIDRARVRATARPHVNRPAAEIPIYPWRSRAAGRPHGIRSIRRECDQRPSRRRPARPPHACVLRPVPPLCPCPGCPDSPVRLPHARCRRMPRDSMPLCL